MYGYISGISDGDEINYCPYCGGKITARFSDGTATCDECFRRFGVVEAENED